LGAELLLPFCLHFPDDVAHSERCSLSALGQGDALEPLVAGIVAALQVAEALELSQQVVESLLAHAALRGQLRRAKVVGSRPLQDAQVRRAQVGEAALAQSRQEPLEDA